VQKLKISFRKLEELEFQCHQNALRLHFDSVLLYKEKSFASAFALSVIASEEFGKGFAIAEISFQAGFHKRFYEHDEKFLRALFSDHKLKQGWFVSSLFDIFTSKGVLKTIGKLQTEKNNALYVGVRRGNHHIVRPFLVPPSKARKQIRTVNNALIDLIELRLDNSFSEDISDQIFRRRRLLRQLRQATTTLA